MKSWYSKEFEDNLRKVYALATTEDILAGSDWYFHAHHFAFELAVKYSLPLSSVCGVIAALSPGLRWEKNKTDTKVFLDEWNNGARGKRLPMVGTYGWRNIVKAAKCAAGKDPLEVLGGEKVLAFYQLILDPGDKGTVCIDRHAMSILKGSRLKDEELKNIKGLKYLLAANHYRKVAEDLGILPSQLQAITWVTWRRIK